MSTAALNRPIVVRGDQPAVHDAPFRHPTSHVTDRFATVSNDDNQGVSAIQAQPRARRADVISNWDGSRRPMLRPMISFMISVVRRRWSARVRRDKPEQPGYSRM